MERMPELAKETGGMQHAKDKDELIERPLQAQATQSSLTGTTKSAPFESKQLCEYTTRTKIGDGGFGVVFKARHGIDERLYAIKQVAPAGVADTKQSPNTVLREVRFLAELDHPHIVRYYGAWLEKPPPGEKFPWMDSNQPCLYIRMEWCSGPTLDEWLRQNQLPAARPISQTLDWFSQLTSAVKYIHDKDLIHRDIKIGDFGLAIDVAPSSSSRANGGVSQSLSIVGTPIYMSPEQPSGRYKNSTDIFSLGLVFLEMVHSFKTDAERHAVFWSLRSKQRPAVMNKLYKEMDALISWMTAFEPEKRVSSSELDDELKKKKRKISSTSEANGTKHTKENGDAACTSSLSAIAAVDETGSPTSKRLKPDSSSEVRKSCSNALVASSSEHLDISEPSVDDGILGRVNFTDLLPLKLMLRIFGHLYEDDLTRCALVSRKFRAIANHRTLWKSLYQEVFEYSLPLLHVGHAQFEFREPHDWPQPRSVTSFVPVQTVVMNAETNDDGSIVVNPWKESFKQLRNTQALQKDGIHVRPGYASLYSGFGAGGRRLTQCDQLDQALQLVKARGKNAEKLIFLHIDLYILETTMEINSDIQIIGASAGPDIASRVIIEGRFTTSIVLAKGSRGAYLGWMTVRFAPDSEAVDAAIDAENPHPHIHYALQICDDSTALVEHCVIHSSSIFGTTVCVKGSAANPKMRHCVVCDCENTGIYVTDVAQGQFEDCEIARNNDPGVWVENRANPFFRRCHIHNGRSVGIFASDHGMGYFESCNIHNNRLVGIEVRDAANPTVTRCEVHHGQTNGILLHEEARGQFTENRIHSHALSGIQITSHSDPKIARNKIQGNQKVGVFVGTSGQGVLEDNEIFDNVMPGVLIDTGGDPTLRRNKIYDGRDKGVYISGKGRGVFEDNDIYRNARVGIWITSHSDPKVARNKIWSNQESGVLIRNNGQGVLEDNEIFDNAMPGVWIETDGNPTLRRNKIYDGQDKGVYISDKGRGVLEDNDIYRNAQAGMIIESESNPTLRRNRIYEGRAAGIEITSDAMATLESNAIFHNRFGGLLLATGVRPTLRDNKVYDNDDLVGKTIAKGGCLFEITSRTSPTMHDFYRTPEEDAICLNCIRTCHTGHTVHLVRYDSFFCDCGAGTLRDPCKLQSEARDNDSVSPVDFELD